MICQTKLSDIRTSIKNASKLESLQRKPIRGKQPFFGQL